MTSAGKEQSEELAVVLQRLEREARKFEESKARYLEREAEGLQRKPPDRHDTNTLCAATGGRVFCHIRLLTREVLTRP